MSDSWTIRYADRSTPRRQLDGVAFDLEVYRESGLAHLRDECVDPGQAGLGRERELLVRLAQSAEQPSHLRQRLRRGALDRVQRRASLVGLGGQQFAEVWEYLVVLAIIGVGTLGVFAFVVPRSFDSRAAGAIAVALSVLGVLTIAVFWSGLPLLFAGGGALLGWGVRDRIAGKAALALAALAVILDVIVYITDQT